MFLMLLLLISIFLGQPEPLCLLLGLDNLDGFADDVGVRMTIIR